LSIKAKTIKSKVFLLIRILILLLITLSSIASARDYFVSTTGNDSNLGDFKTPWKTVSYSAQKAVAGDTVYLLDGIWYEDEVVFLNSGTSEAPIRMVAYNGTPTLDGIYKNKSGSYHGINLNKKDHIIISGLKIERYYNAISNPGSYITISDCELGDTGEIIVWISKNNETHNIIQNCTLYDAGWNSIEVEGDQSTSPANNIIIRNNTIYNSNVHNAIDLFENLKYITIEDNNLYNNSAGNIYTHIGSQEYLTIRDNCIHESKTTGLYLKNNNNHSLIYNNKFYNLSLKPGIEYNSGYNVSIINNEYFNVSIPIILNSNNENFIIKENYIHEDSGPYRIYNLNKNISILDSRGETGISLYKAYDSPINVGYSNGALFTVTPYGDYNKLTSVFFNSKGSSCSIEQTVGNYSGGIKSAVTYNMTVCPSSDAVNVTINRFNTTFPQDSTLVNFTADTVDGNNVVFSVGDLKPNYCYLVKRDGEKLTATKANCSGYIKFNNSQWPMHTFTVEKAVSSPSQESPISSAGSNKTVLFGSRVCFDGSESTGDNISYEWDFDASDGIQRDAIGSTVNHTYETPGVYTVTLTVTDANNNTDSDTCTVTVMEKSEATKVRIFSPNVSLPGKTFTVDLLIDPSTPISGTQLDFVFNSSKTSVINVTEGDFLKQSGAYTIFSGGTINNSAGTVKNIYGFILGTSNVSSPGTIATVNLTAGNRTGIANFNLSNVLISDADSKSVPYTVTNATVLIDTAPVMSAICCPKSVDEKSTLTFKVSAKDADGDRLILSASGLPEGSSFNRTSGAFTWTPARGQAGVYILTFEVSDGYLTDSENVTVTVNRLNNPPLISSFEPLDGSSFSEGERIRISVNASDAEGQALNYSIMIDGVVCSTGTEYIWETDYSSSGNHTIGVAVSDGIDTIRGQRTIYISECRPRWDVNEDGVVNILDVTSVSQKCGTTVSKPYPRYDVNQDGAVNILDLTLVGNHFGELVK
jgi:PKD repeat protein